MDTVTRIVTVQDTTAPNLILSDATTFEIVQGGNYVETGYTAFDVCDGNLTGAVAPGALDTSALGTVVMTYTVVDASGNQTQATRTVTVTPRAADLDQDGAVDAADIQLLINAALGIG